MLKSYFEFFLTVVDQKSDGLKIKCKDALLYIILQPIVYLSLNYSHNGYFNPGMNRYQEEAHKPVIIHITVTVQSMFIKHNVH